MLASRLTGFDTVSVRRWILYNGFPQCLCAPVSLCSKSIYNNFLETILVSRLNILKHRGTETLSHGDITGRQPQDLFQVMKYSLSRPAIV